MPRIKEVEQTILNKYPKHHYKEHMLHLKIY